MKTSHVVVAALVALATTAGLRAAARHRYYSRFGGGPRGCGGGRWGHRFGPGALPAIDGTAPGYSGWPAPAAR